MTSADRHASADKQARNERDSDGEKIMAVRLRRDEQAGAGRGAAGRIDRLIVIAKPKEFDGVVSCD